MKTKIVLSCLLLVSQVSFSQWMNSGSNIQNTNNGDVVVGNTSNLKVYGKMISYYPKSNSPMSGEFSGTSAYWGFRTDTDNKFHIDIYNSNNPKSAFVIDQNGNVGIGGNPLYKLQVNSDAASNFRIVSNGSTASYPSIDVFDNVNGTEFVLSPSSGKVDLFTYTAHALALGTSNTERMRILSNGYVGIGTTTPQMNLELVGAGQIIRNTPTVGYTTLRLYNDQNNAVRGLEIDYSGSNYPSSLLNTGPVGESAAITTTGAYPLSFGTSNTSRMTIASNGNVGVGTTTPDAKLAVKGTVHAQEVKVDLNVPGPDYVFEENYNLPSLTEIENYIKQNKHLPEVPSAKEMEANGINLSEMNMILLKKIEELTLHLIEQNKTIGTQNERIRMLENKID